MNHNQGNINVNMSPRSSINSVGPAVALQAMRINSNSVNSPEAPASPSANSLSVPNNADEPRLAPRLGPRSSADIAALTQKYNANFNPFNYNKYGRNNTSRREVLMRHINVKVIENADDSSSESDNGSKGIFSSFTKRFKKKKKRSDMDNTDEQTVEIISNSVPQPGAAP